MLSESHDPSQEVIESSVSLPPISSRSSGFLVTMPGAQYNEIIDSNFAPPETTADRILVPLNQIKQLKMHAAPNIQSTIESPSLWKPPSGRDRYRRRKYIKSEARWASHLQTKQDAFLERVQERAHRDVRIAKLPHVSKRLN